MKNTNKLKKYYANIDYIRLNPFFLIFFIITLWASVSFADAVYLRRGAKIIGEIVRYNNEGVSIQGQEILYSYPWNHVDHIEIFSLRDKLKKKEQVQLSKHKEDISHSKNLYARARSLVKIPAPGFGRKTKYSLYDLQKILLGFDKEDPQVLALLLFNYEAIDLFKKAIDHSSDRDSGYIRKFQPLFTLLLIQAQDYLVNGQTAKAEENYRSAAKFIRFLWQRENAKYSFNSSSINDPATLDRCLDDFSLEILKAMQANQLSKTFYESIIKELTTVKISAESGKIHLADVYLYTDKEIKKEMRGLDPRLWDSVEEYALFFMILADTPQQQKEMKEELQSYFKDLDAKDSSVFFPTSNHYIAGSIRAYYRIAAKHHNLLLAAAIQAYRMEYKDFPESLNDLIPKYLSELPVDPFRNFEPVTYLKKENDFLLYSIGPDLIDQKGKIVSRDYGNGWDSVGDILWGKDYSLRRLDTKTIPEEEKVPADTVLPGGRRTR